MEITLREVEVAKLNVKPGDIVSVTIRSDDIDLATLNIIRDKFKDILPGVKVLLFGISKDDKIEFAIMKEAEVSYCSNCNCGKKEGN